MDIGKKFGMTIYRLRVKSEDKLTQADVAAYAEISLRYYVDLEKGVKNPTLKVIDDIAKAYGLKSWELLRLMENIG